MRLPALPALLVCSLLVGGACDGTSGSDDGSDKDGDGRDDIGWQDIGDLTSPDYPPYPLGGLGGGSCEEVLGGQGGVAAHPGAATGDPTLPVQLPGCPSAEPQLSACEGPAASVECLYPADGFCMSAWHCNLGIWSPAGQRCADHTLTLWAASSAHCPALLPIGTTPCSEAMECLYSECRYTHSHQASCRCGRWEVERYGCYTVP